MKHGDEADRDRAHAIPEVTVDPVTQVAGQLRLTVTRLARRLRQQTEGQLSPSLLSALSAVAREGPVTLGDLAASELIQPSTITVIVGRLEEQGLVLREIDAQDRRIARVRLSAAGRRLVERNRTRKNAYLARRLRALDRADVEVLGRAADILDRVLEERP